jgi:hypothetical protein
MARTQLEIVVGSRVWRGATVTRGEHNNRPAYLLAHPSGATAAIYVEPGDMAPAKWRKLGKKLTEVLYG